jgi:DNA-binding transcriptional LysR family regulator
VGVVASFQRVPAEFEAEVLQRIPFVAVLAPQHRFASQPSVALRALIEESFILCQRQATPVLYDQVIQRCGESPRVTQEVSDIRMVLGLVAANLGVSLVPASAMLLRTDGVIYRPLADDGDAIAVETALVYHRKSRSPVVEGFLAVARELLAPQ